MIVLIQIFIQTHFRPHQIQYNKWLSRIDTSISLVEVFCVLRPLQGEPCMCPCRILDESVYSHFFKPAQQPKVGAWMQFLSVDSSAGAEHQKTRSFWHTSGLRGISSAISAWQCAVLKCLYLQQSVLPMDGKKMDSHLLQLVRCVLPLVSIQRFMPFENKGEEEQE